MHPLPSPLQPLPHCCPVPGGHTHCAVCQGSGKRPAQAVCGCVPRLEEIPGSSECGPEMGAVSKQQGTQPLGSTPHSDERHRARPPGRLPGAVQPLSPSMLSQEGTPCSSRLWFILPCGQFTLKIYLGQNLRINSHHHFYCWSHFNYLINFELAQNASCRGGKKKAEPNKLKLAWP